MTLPPDWLLQTFRSCVMLCPAVNDQARLQEVIGLPRLVTLTSVPNPPSHWLLTVAANRQPAAA